MPKLTNICLLLAILSLCARLSLGCTTRPTIEHSTRPTWSPCFPDCEKGFQCQAAYLSGLPWVVKLAVFVWQLVPYYEIFHNFQFRICVPVSKKEYESYDIQTDDIIGRSGDYFIPRPTPSGPPYRKDFLWKFLY